MVGQHMQGHQHDGSDQRCESHRASDRGDQDQKDHEEWQLDQKADQQVRRQMAHRIQIVHRLDHGGRTGWQVIEASTHQPAHQPALQGMGDGLARSIKQLQPRVTKRDLQHKREANPERQRPEGFHRRMRDDAVEHGHREQRQQHAKQVDDHRRQNELDQKRFLTAERARQMAHQHARSSLRRQGLRGWTARTCAGPFAGTFGEIRGRPMRFAGTMPPWRWAHHDNGA